MTTNSALENTVKVLKKALEFYANEGRYARWSRYEERNHWVFDPKTWGSAKYHSEPPPEAETEPWSVAEIALQEIEPMLESYARSELLRAIA